MRWIPVLCFRIRRFLISFVFSAHLISWSYCDDVWKVSSVRANHWITIRKHERPTSNSLFNYLFLSFPIHSMFWGAIVTALFTFLFFGGVVFLFAYHITRPYAAWAAAIILGFSITLTIKVCILTIFRYYFYRGMYRRKVAAANFLGRKWFSRVLSTMVSTNRSSLCSQQRLCSSLQLSWIAGI